MESAPTPSQLWSSAAAGHEPVRRPVESARAPPPLATSCRSLLIMTAPLASYRYHLLVSQSPLLHFSFSCRAEALREGGSEFLLLFNFSTPQFFNASTSRVAPEVPRQDGSTLSSLTSGFPPNQ